MAKSILLKHYENGNKNFFCNTSQGPPNPRFMQEKVQKGDFLKKPSRELNFLFCFRFLCISRRPRTLNWERVFFWLSTNLYKQCEMDAWKKLKLPKVGKGCLKRRTKNINFQSHSSNLIFLSVQKAPLEQK